MSRHTAASPRYFAVRRAVVLAPDAAASRMQFDDLVRELAERSVASTRRRLCADSDRLEASELRGYVRARAVSTIRSLVRDLVAEGRLPLVIADDVAAQALERTVHLVVRDTMKRPIVFAPIRITVRQAA